jgi:hypothetical protein
MVDRRCIALSRRRTSSCYGGYQRWAELLCVHVSSYLELVDQDGDGIQLIVLSTALHVLSGVVYAGGREDDTLGVFEYEETEFSPKLEESEWSLLPRQNSTSGFGKAGADRRAGRLNES